jgi:hypothetical protein
LPNVASVPATFPTSSLNARHSHDSLTFDHAAREFLPHSLFGDSARNGLALKCQVVIETGDEPAWIQCALIETAIQFEEAVLYRCINALSLLPNRSSGSNDAISVSSQVPFDLPDIGPSGFHTSCLDVCTWNQQSISTN